MFTMFTVIHFKKGVPKGSGLGPILLTIYMLPLSQIICQYGLSFQSYADDPQLYLTKNPSSQLPLLPLVNYRQ